MMLERIVKGIDKPIFINTGGRYVGIQDMFLRVIDLKDNSVVVNDVQLKEVLSTGVYSAVINITEVGTYFLQAYSNTISSSTTINKIIEVVAYDSLSKIESEAALSRKLQSNKAVVSADGLSVNIYDDDGITILKSYNISSDKRTRTPV